MKKLYLVCMISGIVQAGQYDDLECTRALKNDFEQAMVNAEKTPTVETLTVAWKLGVSYMLSIAPSKAREQVVIPFAKWVKHEVKKRPQLLRNVVKPFLPANAGLLIAIFLEATMPEDALLALFILTKADALYWTYPDSLLITALSQLLLTVTISEDYLMPLMIIIEEEPFTFFKVTGSWGSVLHLLVDLVIGKTDQDLPPYLETSMAALVSAIVHTVRVGYPTLLSVRNSDNKTAFDLAAQKALLIRAKKPHCAEILDTITLKIS